VRRDFLIVAAAAAVGTVLMAIALGELDSVPAAIGVVVAGVAGAVTLDRRNRKRRRD